MRAIHCGDALHCDPEETLRAATSFRGRIAGAGADVALGFEAIERGVGSSYGNFPLCARFDFTPNGYSISLIAKTQEGEQYNVFEFAEVVARRHFPYNIE